MLQITVGHVAGLIAALIFILNILTLTTLTFVLSGLLSDRNSAATWTVASQAFERSHWPFLLRTDVVYNHGVRRPVLLLTIIITFMSYLISLAGIVTPLGLQQVLGTQPPTAAQFQYAPDLSAFGYGTPPRSNVSFSRQCAGGDYDLNVVTCPFSDTITVVTGSNNGTITYSYPYGYNLTIPQRILDTYSSGTQNATTLSNFFDIQYRQYMTAQDPIANNGSAYQVGVFRFIESLVLNGGFQAVEGLIIDLDNGGVGFRNHTFPTGFPNGVSWSEDLLFIEPETVCVDTNLTFDFTVSAVFGNRSVSTTVNNFLLTDRGGFSQLNHKYPEANVTDAQANPDLYGRAYKAAWINNAYTALYYNVTDIDDPSLHTKAWSYLNSYVGKTFPVPAPDFTTLDGTMPAFSISTIFGDYLGLDNYGDIIVNYSSPQSSAPPPNPFNVTTAVFTDALLLCQGTDQVANISNVMITCGLMYGAPRRQDGSPGVVFESGSSWTQPIYACASAVKATVKTVSFTYNGTADLLQGLTITNVQDKTYDNSDDLPLWGVEQTGTRYDSMGINLIWGLISPAYEGNDNVSTVQKSSLYLPGISTSQSLYSVDNLPAAEFFPNCMAAAYSVGSSATTTPPVDYTGQTNLVMFAKWQNITRSASTAARVQNLIWTDYAASLVVGTKGVSGAGPTASNTSPQQFVTPTVNVVQYNYLYGIPVFLAGAGFLLAVFAALGTVLFHRHNLDRLRLHIQQTSAGRIFTTLLDPTRSSFTLKAKIWARDMGDAMIDPSAETIIHGHLKTSPKIEQAFDSRSNGAAAKDDAHTQIDQVPEQSREKQKDDAVQEDAGTRVDAETRANAEATTNVEGRTDEEASVL